jgi:hypothetical protein
VCKGKNVNQHSAKKIVVTKMKVRFGVRSEIGLRYQERSKEGDKGRAEKSGHFVVIYERA